MFKELNPLLHSELRLAVMSILIGIEKTFRGKMPCTVCRITDTGRDAFAEYVAALQTYIRK